MVLLLIFPQGRASLKDAIARMLKEGADLRLQMIESMTADIAGSSDARYSVTAFSKD